MKRFDVLQRNLIPLKIICSRILRMAWEPRFYFFSWEWHKKQPILLTNYPSYVMGIASKKVLKDGIFCG